MYSIFIGEIIYYPGSTYDNIDQIEIMLKNSVDMLKNKVLLPDLFSVKNNNECQNKINIYMDFDKYMDDQLSVRKIKEICKNYNYFYQRIKDIFSFRYVGNQHYPVYSIHLHSLQISP